MKQYTYISEDKEIIKEWDSEENSKKGLNPDTTAYGSNKGANWICKRGHKWVSKINNRTILKRGCPYCANKKVWAGFNDLATLKPELTKEWHPTLNGDFLPSMISVGSGKKVWWLCKEGHSFLANPLHRASKNPTGCPICQRGRQTSFAEQAVFYYVKKLYPDALNRVIGVIDSKLELDIFIPSIRYAIEYDGAAWHGKDKLEREQRKYKNCQDKGIKLIRLREEFAELGSDIADRQFGCKDLYKVDNLERVIIQLLDSICFQFSDSGIDVNIERDRFEILKYKNSEEDSFADCFPEIAKEWHYKLNNDMLPVQFKPHSDIKVWWECSSCGQIYKASIGHRSYGTGCPKCGIKKSADRRSQAVLMINPETEEIVKRYPSISEAGRETNISISNITSVCKGNRKKAGGYFWKYDPEKNR